MFPTVCIRVTDVVDCSFPELIKDASIQVEDSIEIRTNSLEHLDILEMHQVMRDVFSHFQWKKRSFTSIDAPCQSSQTSNYYQQAWKKYIKRTRVLFESFMQTRNTAIINEYIAELNEFIPVRVVFVESTRKLPKTSPIKKQDPLLAKIKNAPKDIQQMLENKDDMTKIRETLNEKYEIDCDTILNTVENVDGCKPGTSLKMITDTIKDLKKANQLKKSKIYNNAHAIAVLVWGWDVIDSPNNMKDYEEFNQGINQETKIILPERSSSLNYEMKRFYYDFISGRNPKRENYKLLKTAGAIADHEKVFASYSKKRGLPTLRL